MEEGFLLKSLTLFSEHSLGQAEDLAHRARAEPHSPLKSFSLPPAPLTPVPLPAAQVQGGIWGGGHTPLTENVVLQGLPHKG